MSGASELECTNTFRRPDLSHWAAYSASPVSVNVQFLKGTSAQEGYLVPFKVYMMDRI